MAVTKPERKSSYLQEILESEEYQSNVKALQDWLTGATQVATQQYQATAQTAAEQASYDISGAYANYLKQQRAVTAQGQLESGHKEEIGDVLQQQYQGAYSQARSAQAQTVAKAQEQYGEDVSYANQLYKKNKQELLDAATKEADILANIFKAGETYAGLTDYKQNITEFGAEIRNEQGKVIGTGKGIYDVDDKGYHTLTKYGTDVFRKALLQDEGFKNYLEEEGLTDELEYYLGNAPSVHEKLFGFTETKYDAKSDVSRDATYGTKGYLESFEKPNTSDYVDLGRLNPGPASKSPTIIVDKLNDPIDKYAKQIGLSDDDIKKALGNRSIKDYLKDIADEAESERNRSKFVTNELNQMYDILLNASRSKYNPT